MIERVVLAGSDVELDRVLLSILIRHGRQDVDDGPLGSTAQLTLLEPTREQIQQFAAGSELELLLAADVPRFTGRITDAKLNEDGLQVLAASSLGRIGARIVGADAWPSESWRARIARVLNEAGVGRTWADIDPGEAWNDSTPDGAASSPTWNVSPTSTIPWIDYALVGHVRFEWVAMPAFIGSEDEGPTIAARDAGETTLGAYLSGDFYASEPFTLASLPNGELLLQRLTYRSYVDPFGPAKPELELDPDVVLFAPEFEQTDDVENALELTYSAGTVTAENAGSIATFERRPARIATELELLADAELRAALRVHRRGFPRWLTAPVDLLELRDDLSIGSPVRLSELPEWAPGVGYLGILEGWEDRVEPDGAGGVAWSQKLYLSDPRISGGFGVVWSDTIETWANVVYWNELGSETWADPDGILDYL